MKYLFIGSALLASLLFSGCDEGCCQDVALVDTALTPTGNQIPIPVITGLPAKAPCGTELTALATQSSDPDGTIVNYAWTLDGKAMNDSETGTLGATLPCDGKNHKVCLTVTDDKGASQTTCQTIVVDNGTPEPKPADSCDIVPVITYEKADAMQYKFLCTESTYNGQKIDEATAATCEWSANKYFKNGDNEIHGQTGPAKWVNVDPEIFRAMDLTLTVTKGDCRKSITKHYFIPADLPY